MTERAVKLGPGAPDCWHRKSLFRVPISRRAELRRWLTLPHKFFGLRRIKLLRALESMPLDERKHQTPILSIFCALQIPRLGKSGVCL